MPKRYARKNNKRKSMLTKRIKAISRSQALKVAESKYSCSLIAQSVSTTHYINGSFMTIPAGTTVGTRLGSSIRGCYLRFNFKLANGDDSNIVRIMLIESNRNAVWNTLLPSAHGCITPALRSQVKKIHRDFAVALNSGGVGGTVQKTFKMHVNLRGKLIEYEDATLQAPTKSGFYLVFVSDSGAINHPSVDVDVQFCYKDA